MQENKLFPLSGTAWNSTVDWVKCCDPLHLGFGREVMKKEVAPSTQLIYFSILAEGHSRL